MNRIDLLTENFQSVRRYTNMVIDGIRPDDWFRVPDVCPTHIAWQIGHITIGNYGLALAIPRGDRPDDVELVPVSFREKFARDSTPDPNPSAYPPVELIMATFDRVHDQILAELPTFTDELLDDSVPIEHPMFSTKFGSLLWSIQHGYTHAGQISLLYRLNGGAPRF